MHRFIILLGCIFAPLAIARILPSVTCGPVCAIACRYGNVLDKNGCPTCECRKSPCKYGQDPLEGYSCGFVVNRTDCPPNYTCVIAPNDAYAVCCPRFKQPVTKPIDRTEKPGSCPIEPTGMVGNCLAECTYDSQCSGIMKCCGNCPRKCVLPV